ncbi:hypothetical protein CBW65_23390 [Tumebacillus avium]|uniref:Luciferase-like domain-containing protein n=1 Tax=Tumebacillus avium TaxID=1903704 RepID=A0A1Y0ITK0_9BACL|nr:LLM class flavin-dependent oxidoreductase [Tumebacillus avium]ARU63630.1 hypothetical protein CBW65_23390 [Tumebacillus avium]
MNDLNKRLAALSPEQRALLEKQLKKQGLDTLVKKEDSGTIAVTLPGADSSQPAFKGAGLQKKERDPNKGMDFSLYFFSGDGSTASRDKYRLLVDCAKHGDEHGYAAIWTPERHFQDFGGLYPNPAVLSAALAMVTKNIELRAGSVAIPLHHPIRVAEEWSVVDNLSGGRIAICAASGWHPNDFILSPKPNMDYYKNRRNEMIDALDIIQRLWQGETVTMTGIDGEEVSTRILPRPIQKNLEFWFASQGAPETLVKAGEMGGHILTGLVNQPLHELEQKIKLYRDARAKAGHDPETGKVAVMLHTFLGTDNNTVKEQARTPLTNYLRTFLRQQDNFKSDFDLATEADKDALVSFAYERYFEESTLLGTVDKCETLINNLIDIGVTEVACLVDFGLEPETVLEGLTHLNELQERYRVKLSVQGVQ